MIAITLSLNIRTNAKPPIPSGESFLLLANGTDFLLLADGTSQLLLN